MLVHYECSQKLDQVLRRQRLDQLKSNTRSEDGKLGRKAIEIAGRIPKGLLNTITATTERLRSKPATEDGKNHGRRRRSFEEIEWRTGQPDMKNR